MRAIAIAVTIAVVSLIRSASASAPQTYEANASGAISYAAGDLCDQAVNHSYRFDVQGQVFSTEGSPVRVAERISSWAQFVGARSGTSVTTESRFRHTIDLTVQDFTSDYSTYRGLQSRLRSADGQLLAIVAGQLRIDRFGDVTFEAGRVQPVDICAFLG